MSDTDSRLIWLDLEMTGLDPETDSILEIATLVTDSGLGEVAEGPVLAIRHEREVLNAMDQWNTETHTASGLVGRVLESRVTMAEAERQTLKFLAGHGERNSSPMCGNSICQDRRFLARHMPELCDWFHYRNLDVSTLKELCQRWAPEIAAGHRKENRHEALSDIRESIEELRYYRRFMGELGAVPRREH
jgi:oligoribonuclease